jgi:hypothetical protein
VPLRSVSAFRVTPLRQIRGQFEAHTSSPGAFEQVRALERLKCVPLSEGGGTGSNPAGAQIDCIRTLNLYLRTLGAQLHPQRMRHAPDNPDGARHWHPMLPEPDHGRRRIRKHDGSRRSAGERTCLAPDCAAMVCPMMIAWSWSAIGVS